MNTQKEWKRAFLTRGRLVLMSFGFGNVLIGLSRLPDDLLQRVVLCAGRMLAVCLPW